LTAPDQCGRIEHRISTRPGGSRIRGLAPGAGNAEQPGNAHFIGGDVALDYVAPGPGSTAMIGARRSLTAKVTATAPHSQLIGLTTTPTRSRPPTSGWPGTDPVHAARRRATFQLTSRSTAQGYPVSSEPPPATLIDGFERDPTPCAAVAGVFAYPLWPAGDRSGPRCRTAHWQAGGTGQMQSDQRQLQF